MAQAPDRYQNKVVCLPCLDGFARKQSLDYSNSTRVLYFAGNKAEFKIPNYIGARRLSAAAFVHLHPTFVANLIAEGWEVIQFIII
jgi:hypothetical protein